MTKKIQLKLSNRLLMVFGDKTGRERNKRPISELFRFRGWVWFNHVCKNNNIAHSQEIRDLAGHGNERRKFR